MFYTADIYTKPRADFHADVSRISPPVGPWIPHYYTLFVSFIISSCAVLKSKQSQTITRFLKPSSFIQWRVHCKKSEGSTIHIHQESVFMGRAGLKCKCHFSGRNLITSTIRHMQPMIRYVHFEAGTLHGSTFLKHISSDFLQCFREEAKTRQ